LEPTAVAPPRSAEQVQAELLGAARSCWAGWAARRAGPQRAPARGCSTWGGRSLCAVYALTGALRRRPGACRASCSRKSHARVTRARVRPPMGALWGRNGAAPTCPHLAASVLVVG